MMRLKSGLAAALVTLVMTVCCLGQAAVSTAGGRVQASGFSFTPPAGWKMKQDQGYVLVEPAGKSIVMITTHRYNDFESVLRDTTLDEGEVAGKPQDLKGGGKTIRVTKNTADGVGVIDLFTLFSPHGGGVLVMALSESKNADGSFHAGLGVADSVTFSRSVPSSAQSAAAPGWQSRLAGKHLIYLYSGNGYFEEKHIYLCTSGTFYQSTGSGGFTPNNSDGGSFAARGGNRGRWSVSGSTLVLQFQDGSVGEYNLTQRSASNEIGMNGRRYFVKSDANCN